MLFRIRFAMPVVLLLYATLFAAVPCTLPAGIERLANGNTVICDAGAMGQPTARVIEVDSLGHLVWAYVSSDIQWAHTARRIDNGNTLVTATDSNRVFEVTPRGDVVWEMRSGLTYPNEAYRLANGNTLITQKNANRVTEVDTGRNVVWSYTNLSGPHNGSRLANGHTLICNSDANKVIEADSAGTVVWQYGTGLSWARNAKRLSNGNTLITDSRHNRVIEVDSAGTTVWSLTSGLSLPYEAARLANGHTLVSTGARVIEVDSATNIVWEYPPVMASVVAVETLWVVNPASGCSLYVHIHRPISAKPSAPVPAVVLVPDLSSAGTTFESFADSIASEGFAVLHFDADGRGRSGGTEDYDGYVHQDGLAACAETLTSRPYVDADNLGIYSRGYGIVMATGMVARHTTPRVKFLMDWEGPSDRYQASTDSGGHVPVPVDAEAFWAQREAARLIKSVPGAYLRIQTATDHTGRIPNNHHAIALIDSATSTAHGGSGIAVWTRVNDSVMNPENTTYSVFDPPLWTRETEDRNRICREILYLRELVDSDFSVEVAESPTFDIRHSTSDILAVSPNPCRGSAVLRWTTGQLERPTTLRIFDATGRLVSSFLVHGSSFNVPVPATAGVYVLRADSDSRVATTRLVVEH
jgi:hypothetical protein